MTRSLLTPMTLSPTSRWSTRAGGEACAGERTAFFQPITLRFGNDGAQPMPSPSLCRRGRRRHRPCCLSTPRSFLSPHRSVSTLCETSSGLQLSFAPFSVFIFVHAAVVEEEEYNCTNNEHIANHSGLSKTHSITLHLKLQDAAGLFTVCFSWLHKPVISASQPKVAFWSFQDLFSIYYLLYMSQALTRIPLLIDVLERNFNFTKDQRNDKIELEKSGKRGLCTGCLLFSSSILDCSVYWWLECLSRTLTLWTKQLMSSCASWSVCVITPRCKAV